ncbi:hypothetical protein [Mesorhizobium sp. IMUNJ 23232]|uniref:hypothetical protein n=1 Tax=Mesorhizobium sp. IMUNJ 23232 TaxID=3376064 RepID=UPI00378ABE16
MTASPAPERGGEAVPVDPVDHVLSEFEGDARAGIEALLSEVGRLEHETALTRPVVSRGFSRGWHHDRWADNGKA